jgi:hypothetical protein
MSAILPGHDDDNNPFEGLTMAQSVQERRCRRLAGHPCTVDPDEMT